MRNALGKLPSTLIFGAVCWNANRERIGEGKKCLQIALSVNKGRVA